MTRRRIVTWVVPAAAAATTLVLAVAPGKPVSPTAKATNSASPLPQQTFLGRTSACDNVKLPMYRGRVDSDRVAWQLAPDDGVMSFYYLDAKTKQSVGASIAYRDTHCHLPIPIRAFVNAALTQY